MGAETGWGKGKLAGALGALAVLFGGVVTWMTSDALQGTVCNWGPVYGRSLDTVCRVEFRQVPITDATDFAYTFIGQAGAERERKSWDAMESVAQERFGGDEWRGLWDDVLWAEVVEVEPDPAVHNRFTITYRTFPGTSNEASSGLVQNVEASMDMRRDPSGEGLRVVRLTSPDRVGHAVRAPYAALYLTETTVTRETPHTTGKAVQGSVKKGGMLRALCQLAQTDDSWWFRTPLGWVSEDQVRPGVRPVDGVLQCDEHHLQAAGMQVASAR